jgi:hypothetical protein
LEETLSDPKSRKSRVFHSYSHYLKTRQGHSAFKPLADQQILDLHNQVFSVLRTSQDGSESILCLINISNHSLSLHIDPQIIQPSKRLDLLTKTEFSLDSLELKPYQVLWLK